MTPHGVATRWVSQSLAPLVLALCLPVLAQDTPRLQGTVIRVIDGNTIEVELKNGPIRVQLSGIDAPESDQPVGTEATLTLAKLIDGKVVLLEVSEQKDSYDRMIAEVHLGDRNINLEMVALGYAWADRPNMKRSTSELCSLEFAARKAHIGLWSRPVSDWIAPWEWRKLEKRSHPSDYSHETAGACAAAIGKHE